MQTKQSRRVAIGGMVSALCLLLMFMTGLFPFATFAMPAFAGLLILVIVVEIGMRWAWLVYLGVAILSIFIAPDREAALLFAVFFGYYPIARLLIERIRLRPLVWVCKFALFNLALGGLYGASVALLGTEQLIASFGEVRQYGLATFWILFNITFVAYDFALKQLFLCYVGWFRPRFLRRIG